MKYALGLLCVVLLWSCKKDDQDPDVIIPRYDTIYPLPYFPAYPGSYWVYSTGDTLKIEDQYELYGYNRASWGTQPIIDSVYLPRFKPNYIYFNGNQQGQPYTYVYQYTISTVTYRLPFKTILSEGVSAPFPTSEYFGGNAGYGKTTKTDTSLTINDQLFEHVIEVINYSWNSNMGNLPWSVREYYAKDVGLIKRERRSYLDTTVVTLDFELMNYKINK